MDDEPEPTSERSIAWRRLREGTKRAANNALASVPPAKMAGAKAKARSTLERMAQSTSEKAPALSQTLEEWGTKLEQSQAQPSDPAADAAVSEESAAESAPVRTGAGIFVSYRRKDSPGYVRALVEPLNRRFGRDRVFVDVDTIEAGGNFKEQIEEAVGGCAVLIAVIGTAWVTAQDDQGRRRLDSPNDFIRLEVGTALRRNILVLPVLVNGAQMPDAEDLPPDLAVLTERQALELNEHEWEPTVERLISVIAEAVDETESSNESMVRLGSVPGSGAA